VTIVDRAHISHYPRRADLYLPHLCSRADQADTRALAADQPQSLSVIGTLARRAPDRRFSAVSGCGREWDYRAQISLFGRT
jgi:hypothetical protein